jgi:hypothetical protein
MNWIEKRNEFQDRFDQLSQENIQGLITDLNKTLSQYISKGGITEGSNNDDYIALVAEMTKANQIKEGYNKLNEDIINYIETNGKVNNLGTLLSENGQIQKDINAMEKINKELNIDAETAIARDNLLRSRESDITKYKLFILDRPIRKGLIPYLWAIVILFIGIGVVIFKMTWPIISTSSVASGSTGFLATLLLFLTDKRLLVSLLAASLITIAFLSMKIAGVFGK